MDKSESIVALAKALCEFQGSIKPVKKDATNSFFKAKYATLDAIWEAIRVPLKDRGLSVVQTINWTAENKSLLDTMLLHTSGEWLSGSMIINPTKADPQGLGSAISYARRYALCAMLGIVSDEDDDGNTATKAAPETEPQAQPKKHYDTTTLAGALGYLSATNPNKWGHDIVATRLMDKYGIQIDTVANMLKKLSAEQAEELLKIVSAEIRKAPDKKSK